jgi:hypothetical protein
MRSREEHPTFRSPFSTINAPRCCGKSARRRNTLDDSLRLDVNADIVVRVDDMKQHVKLFLLDMSERDARLRAGVLLPPQTGVSFRWVGPSREALVLHGHVSDIRMADKRTAEYAVEFSLPQQTQDHLARELQKLQRRKPPKPAVAAVPASTENGEDDDLADFESSRDRKAYRAMVQFPVGVKTERKRRVVTLEAEARDLSIGGMLLLLPEELEESTDLELSFTLPVDAHGLEGTKEVVEMTPFGERRIKKSAPKRRTEQLFVKARVLKKTGSARNGSPLFGVEFVDVPGFLTEEIARWIHAHQIKQLRTGPAARKSASAVRVTRKVQSEPTTSQKMTRALFTPHASERRFTFAAYAKNHEIVRLPQHAAKPAVTRGTDIFGLGVAADAQIPKTAEIVHKAEPVDDVFGLGVLQDAS